MLEEVVAFVRTLDDGTIYFFLFVIAYLENVVPPIPGDLPIAFVGSLIAITDPAVPIHDLSFAWCWVWSSAGSLLGFMNMYGIGWLVGRRVYGDTENNSRFAQTVRRFFPPENLRDVQQNFSKYSYWLIAANRFLTGSRSIISISSGLSHLNFFYVHLCALLSAVLWNALLIYGGVLLGDNWRLLGDYLTTYGLLFSVIVLGIVGFFIYRFIQKRKAAKEENPPSPLH